VKAYASRAQIDPLDEDVGRMLGAPSLNATKARYGWIIRGIDGEPQSGRVVASSSQIRLTALKSRAACRGVIAGSTTKLGLKG
jgi:hypothetical protein